MLEGIRAIGEAALERGPLVEALIDTRILEQQGQQKERGLAVTLNVQIEPLALHVDARELDEATLAEILWVGNAASNNLQDRLTVGVTKWWKSADPTYLASQTVPNLLEALLNGALKTLLRRVKEAVYLDLGEKSEVFPEGGGDRQYERYRQVWDLPKLGFSDPALVLEAAPRPERDKIKNLLEKQAPLTRGFLRSYACQKGSAKAACELVGKTLKAWVVRRLDVGSSQIKLYTLAVEGELLVRHPDYRAYIERRLVDEAFEGFASAEGACHLCGARGQVTADTTRFKLLKFYITDKLGFASGLHKKGFLRNYTLCRGCYRALLAGERFMENDLRTRLGRSTVYVIPTFHAPEAYPTAETIAGWACYLKDRLAASDTLEGWHKFQQELEGYQRFEEQKALFVLNLLFATKATKGQAAVKIDKLLADVPPSRLDRVDEVRNAVRDWACEQLGEDAHGEWDLGLGKLFYLLPLRQRDRQAETKPYLELLDALLTDRPVKVGALISQLLETACVHHFERYEAHVQGRPQDPDRALVLHMLQSQLFLRYLKELGQLRGLEGGEIATMAAERLSEIEQTALDEGLKSWMDGLELAGARRGLFLLGVLIGRIGSTPEQRGSGKPILNKVHFQGMDRLKVMRLANEVYEKLRQYKIADYYEGLYAAMKAHLDRALGELGSPQENVYWVLSGYAYATWGAIRAGQLKRQPEGEVEAPETEEREVLRHE